MDMRKIIVLFLCCCLNGVTKAIDLDYFFGIARSSGCNDGNSPQYCKSVCNDVPAICDNGDCYCHQSILSGLTKLSKASAGSKTKVLLKLIDDEDSGEYLPDLLETDRAVLRHHIAHFCPNLEIARDCIRKCANMGKPAFCGKDHKCYCGHKYEEQSNNNKNSENTQKDFADLYAKYLGYRPHIDDHDITDI